MTNSPIESVMSFVEDSVSSEPFNPLDNLLPFLSTPNSAPGPSCPHSLDGSLSTIKDDGLQSNFDGSSFTTSVAPAQTLGVTSPESADLLATHFQRPDQRRLQSALRCILISDWYNRGNVEPKTTHRRSTYHQFLKPLAGTSNYACLFDGCVYTTNRQDRAIAHIRAHVHHRPFVCGGKCKKRNW